MDFCTVEPKDFLRIRDFYWTLIDQMQSKKYLPGWQKGIYPSDEFLQESIAHNELSILCNAGEILGAVIANEQYNDGYTDAPWQIVCEEKEILYLHTLAVAVPLQGKGIGKKIVEECIALARQKGKKAIRLDILTSNHAAERLYSSMGFRFIQTKKMFYPDTGWTEYSLFEFDTRLP